MTKESFKKFVKENKDLIVGSTLVVASMTALAVIGVRLSKPSLAKSTDSVDDPIMDLLTKVDKAGEGCSHYSLVTLSDVNAANGNDCAMERLGRIALSDGASLEIKNLIAFGNIVEP